MANISISKSQIMKGRGVVILPVEEYERLLMIPTIQLKGKEAVELDKLVEEGLREYAAGRTIKASSISAAVKQYRKKHAR